MRHELELMELVEKYLRGEMGPEDREIFEARLQGNQELQDLVQDQQAMLIGMERLALRPAVEKAYKSYRFGKWAPGMGGALLIVVIAITGWMVMAPAPEHSPAEPVQESHSAIGLPGVGLPVPDEQPSGNTSEGVPVAGTTDVLADTMVSESIMLFADEEIMEEDAPVEVVDGPLEIRSRLVDQADYILGTTAEVHVSFTPAEFPGGELEMRKFIYGSLKIPQEARSTGVQLSVVVRFTVTENGTIADVKADPGPGQVYIEEAERVVRAMPKWRPAMNNGEPTEMQLNLPITFLSQMEIMQ